MWMILRFCVLLVLNFGGYLFANDVKGTLKDQNGKALEFASVVLYKLPDSVQVAASLSDEKGFFEFTNIKNGNYYLFATQIGYQKTFSPAFKISSADILPPFDLTVNEVISQIGEVQVVAKKPFVDVQPDKMVVNVEQSVMNAGISAVEVLKRTPGVVVDKDGAVELKGRDGVMVMINGKPMYMDDKQIGTLLKSLPADQIKNIEVITNPSSKYDAAGNAGIININLKKGALEGFNGSANASYGQGFYPKANTGITINYKKKKLSLTAGYQFNYKKNLDQWSVDRRYAPTNSTSRFYTQNAYNSPGINNSLNLNGDYSLTENDIISFNANGNIYKGDWLGGSTSTVIGQNQQISELYSSKDVSKDFFYTLNAGAGYKHKFDTAGTELSFSGNYNRFEQYNDQKVNSSFRNPQGATIYPEFNYFATLPVNLDQQTYQVDFTRPITSKTKIELGAKYINMISSSKIRNETSQGANIQNQQNFFDYSEQILAGYLMAYQTIRKFNINAGVRYEKTDGLGKQISQNIDFKRNYANLFPSAGITFKQTEKTTYSITYSKRIDRPAYNQLNPFVYISDPFNEYRGNEKLLPQLTDNVEFTYSLFYGAFTSTLNYGYTERPIGEVYRINPTTKSTVFTQENLKSFENMGLSVAVNTPITKWWNTSNYIYGFQNIFKGDVGFGNINNRMISFMANSTQNIKLPRNFNIELSGVYQGPSAYNISRYREMWQISMGIQKSLWNEKANVKFAVQDFFWTYQFRGETQLGDTKLNDTYSWDNRVATLTFVYNFGKKFTLPSEKDKKEPNNGGGRGRG